MSYLAVNSAGLLGDIIGVVLIFIFGLPANVSRTGETFLTLEQDDQTEIAKAERYDRWGRYGLVLLITGFGLQIVSNWLLAVQQAGP